MGDTKIPIGLCQCGCGAKTPIAKTTCDRGGSRKKGEPVLYLTGHQTRLSPVDFIEEDRGYETVCWVWQRASNVNGYGVDCRPGSRKAALAHIVSYEKHVGKVPEGLQLDHLCRVPKCVNPKHLEPVTPKENVRRGDTTRLTVEEVKTIYAAEGSHRELAERFGVGKSTIGSIKTKTYWSDVLPNGPAGGNGYTGNSNSRRSREEIQAIRNAKGRLEEVAEQFGLSRSQVYRIRTGQCWSDI